MRADSEVSFLLLVRKYGTDPRFLVSKRTGGKLTGVLTFPGGKVEPGESPAECVVREAREESGLEVPISGLIPINPEPILIGVNDKTTLFYMYYCFNKSVFGIPTQGEEGKNTEWGWISFNAACKYIAAGLLHPMILYDKRLEQTLGCQRCLDKKTGAMLEEIEHFMTHNQEVPSWFLIPRSVRNSLFLI